MKVTGHTTAHVFRHYDIGNVEARASGCSARAITWRRFRRPQR
jgi:hypothetical protein